MPETAASEDSYGLGLLPQHAAQLRESSIDPEVAAERGYRSVTERNELHQFGYKHNQLLVPTLFIPGHNVHGEDSVPQHRPDHPRTGRKKKPIKYETPGGACMAIDVPPRVCPLLGNPRIPLFVTEGAKKADSGASRGLCIIALLGVWNWRGTNTFGGKVALPDWESIALNDREVFIVFDSDVTTKPEVRKAIARLAAFLKSRGAKVLVVILPEVRDDK